MTMKPNGMQYILYTNFAGLRYVVMQCSTPLDGYHPCQSQVVVYFHQFALATSNIYILEVASANCRHPQNSFIVSMLLLLLLYLSPLKKKNKLVILVILNIHSVVKVLNHVHIL